MNRFFKPFTIWVLLMSICFAQTVEPVSYTTMGPDMELLSYGGSLGGFFSYYPRESVSLDVELDWSLVENNDTFTFIDYSGVPVSINNRNLSFVKLMPGITYYPFIDTMHPSFQVGGFLSAGPIWALNTADDEDFIERWGKVESDFAPMIRLGMHFRVLSGQGSSYIFRVGYDHASFDKTIDTRKTYKGLYLQAGMEFLRR